MRLSKCRLFQGVPWNIDYYKIDPSDTQILGPKRVESTKVEAAMRRISERLFLYDSAQRALVEEDMEKSATTEHAKTEHAKTESVMYHFDQNLRSRNLNNFPSTHSNEHPNSYSDRYPNRYLQDFLDQRDAVPRPLPTGQTNLGKYIWEELHKLTPEDSSITNKFAKLFWTNHIRRSSTYHVIVREMLQNNYPKLAQDILQSMLMTRKSGLTVSTYNLCLETAMYNDDHQWFLDLAKRVMQPSQNWGSLQAKFADPNSDQPRDHQIPIDTQFAGQTGLVLLAEGFMKFGHPHLLSNLLSACSSQPDGTKVKLLTVNLEAANRWQDQRRAQLSLQAFRNISDFSKLTTVRFLLVLRRNPVYKQEVASMYAKLTPSMQRNFDRLLPASFKYHHPYAQRRHPHKKHHGTETTE